MSIQDYLKQSRDCLDQAFQESGLHQAVDEAVKVIQLSLEQEKPLLVCGNGGSASDAQHITGELVGRYLKERRALNVICLSDNAAVMTAISNDYDYSQVFARQVQGYGRSGGVLLGLSTSGNSSNVIKAFESAKVMNMKTIALTGKTGGDLAKKSDILINVPATFTPQIQQLHLCIYHYICFELENRLFG